jgi:small subunit ribosomal protein S17
MERTNQEGISLQLPTHWRCCNLLTIQFFNDPKTYLVHDPNNSLRTGDVVAITPGWVTSQHKRHLVKHIIAPSGLPVEKRPPVPTQDEMWAAREAKKAAKDARRAERAEAERLARQKEREEKEERRRRKMAGREEKGETKASDVD